MHSAARAPGVALSNTPSYRHDATHIPAASHRRFRLLAAVNAHRLGRANFSDLLGAIVTPIMPSALGQTREGAAGFLRDAVCSVEKTVKRIGKATQEADNALIIRMSQLPYGFQCENIHSLSHRIAPAIRYPYCYVNLEERKEYSPKHLTSCRTNEFVLVNHKACR